VYMFEGPARMFPGPRSGSRQALRRHISLTVKVRRMVTVDHQ